MKKYLFPAFATIAAIVLIVSCKKEDPETDHQNHPSADLPVITISSPVENDTLASGTINILASITHTSEMHGYQVKLENLTNASTVFTSEEHSHATSYTIDEQWTSNLTDTATLKLTITAAADHDGAEVAKSIQFVCLP